MQRCRAAIKTPLRGEGAKKGSLSAAFYGGDGGNRNRVRNLILTNFYERIRLFKIPSAHRPTAVYALW